MFFWTACVYVVVQFYPWFKFCSPLFLIMVMKDNEFETKENEIFSQGYNWTTTNTPFSSPLPQQDGRSKKTANPVTRVTTVLFEEKKLLQTSSSFKQIFFCKRPENINVKWRSRWNTQIITRSRLSRTSVLPSSSSYRPVEYGKTASLSPSLWLIILCIHLFFLFLFWSLTYGTALCHFLCAKKVKNKAQDPSL